MNRRQLLFVGLSSLIVSDAEAGNRKIRLRVMIESPDATIKQRITVRRGSTVKRVLDRLADSLDIPYAVTYKAWQGQDLNGQGLLTHFANWRNENEEEVPGLTTQTVPGMYWMLFVGPVGRNIESSQYISQLGVDKRRSMRSAQLVIKLTYPNGPFD